jgi:hypothetical protein
MIFVSTCRSSEVAFVYDNVQGGVDVQVQVNVNVDVNVNVNVDVI